MGPEHQDLRRHLGIRSWDYLHIITPREIASRSFEECKALVASRVGDISLVKGGVLRAIRNAVGLSPQSFARVLDLYEQIYQMLEEGYVCKCVVARAQEYFAPEMESGTVSGKALEEFMTINGLVAHDVAAGLGITVSDVNLMLKNGLKESFLDRLKQIVRGTLLSGQVLAMLMDYGTISTEELMEETGYSETQIYDFLHSSLINAAVSGKLLHAIKVIRSGITTPYTGEQVKGIREELGLTQEQLAEAMGKSGKKYVWDMENREINSLAVSRKLYRVIKNPPVIPERTPGTISGAECKAIRIRTGLSQSEFAAMIGLSGKVQVHRLENSKEVSLELTKKIKELFPEDYRKEKPDLPVRYSGEEFRAMRKARGYTLVRMGQILGISDQTVMQMEKRGVIRDKYVVLVQKAIEEGLLGPIQTSPTVADDESASAMPSE